MAVLASRIGDFEGCGGVESPIKEAGWVALLRR